MHRLAFRLSLALMSLVAAEAAEADPIVIDGYAFNFPYGPIPDASGRLQGILVSGEPIDAEFEILGGASLVLVPEPSAVILLAAGAFGLLLCALRSVSTSRVMRSIVLGVAVLLVAAASAQAEISFQGLGSLPGAPYIESRAAAVSADGTVIAGTRYGDPEGAYRWTEQTGVVDLGNLPGNTLDPGATAISADGSTVVGNVPVLFPDGTYAQAYRWTEADGMVDLAPLQPRYVLARAVSADGSVVVGDILPFEPFIWDEHNGMRDLREVLTGDYGLDLTGWKLESVTDISDDGRVLVGNGENPDGVYEAWRAVIPEPSSLLLAMFGGLGPVAYAFLPSESAPGEAKHL